jgi:hypothetical protein
MRQYYGDSDSDTSSSTVVARVFAAKHGKKQKSKTGKKKKSHHQHSTKHLLHQSKALVSATEMPKWVKAIHRDPEGRKKMKAIYEKLMGGGGGGSSTKKKKRATVKRVPAKQRRMYAKYTPYGILHSSKKPRKARAKKGYAASPSAFFHGHRKRPQSEYNKYVKKHMHDKAIKSLDPKKRLGAVAKLWNAAKKKKAQKKK